LVAIRAFSDTRLDTGGFGKEFVLVVIMQKIEDFTDEMFKRKLIQCLQCKSQCDFWTGNALCRRDARRMKESNMTMVTVETELTTGELLSLVQQLDTKEQIEFVQEVMSHWTQEEDFEAVRKWIENE
jgi:hypothetical protein